MGEGNSVCDSIQWYFSYSYWTNHAADIAENQGNNLLCQKPYEIYASLLTCCIALGIDSGLNDCCINI